MMSGGSKMVMVVRLRVAFDEGLQRGATLTCWYTCGKTGWQRVHLVQRCCLQTICRNAKKGSCNFRFARAHNYELMLFV